MLLGERGPVRRGSVEPKTATSGTPKPSARGILPVSLGEENPQLQETLDELRERSLAGGIFCLSLKSIDNFRGYVAVALRADNYPRAGDLTRHEFHRFAKAICWPALGRSANAAERFSLASLR